MANFRSSFKIISEVTSTHRQCPARFRSCSNDPKSSPCKEGKDETVPKTRSQETLKKNDPLTYEAKDDMQDSWLSYLKKKISTLHLFNSEDIPEEAQISSQDGKVLYLPTPNSNEKNYTTEYEQKSANSVKSDKKQITDVNNLNAPIQENSQNSVSESNLFCSYTKPHDDKFKEHFSEAFEEKNNPEIQSKIQPELHIIKEVENDTYTDFRREEYMKFEPEVSSDKAGIGQKVTEFQYDPFSKRRPYFQTQRSEETPSNQTSYNESDINTVDLKQTMPENSEEYKEAVQNENRLPKSKGKKQNELPHILKCPSYLDLIKKPLQNLSIKEERSECSRDINLENAIKGNESLVKHKTEKQKDPHRQVTNEKRTDIQRKGQNLKNNAIHSIPIIKPKTVQSDNTEIPNKLAQNVSLVEHKIEKQKDPHRQVTKEKRDEVQEESQNMNNNATYANPTTKPKTVQSENMEIKNILTQNVSLMEQKVGKQKDLHPQVPNEKRDEVQEERQNIENSPTVSTTVQPDTTEIKNILTKNVSLIEHKLEKREDTDRQVTNENRNEVQEEHTTVLPDTTEIKSILTKNASLIEHKLEKREDTDRQVTNEKSDDVQEERQNINNSPIYAIPTINTTVQPDTTEIKNILTKDICLTEHKQEKQEDTDRQVINEKDDEVQEGSQNLKNNATYAIRRTNPKTVRSDNREIKNILTVPSFTTVIKQPSKPILEIYGKKRNDVNSKTSLSTVEKRSLPVITNEPLQLSATHRAMNLRKSKKYPGEIGQYISKTYPKKEPVVKKRPPDFKSIISANRVIQKKVSKSNQDIKSENIPTKNALQVKDKPEEAQANEMNSIINSIFPPENVRTSKSTKDNTPHIDIDSSLSEHKSQASSAVEAQIMQEPDTESKLLSAGETVDDVFKIADKPSGFSFKDNLQLLLSNVEEPSSINKKPKEDEPKNVELSNDPDLTILKKEDSSEGKALGAKNENPEQNVNLLNMSTEPPMPIANIQNVRKPKNQENKIVISTKSSSEKVKRPKEHKNRYINNFKEPRIQRPITPPFFLSNSKQSHKFQEQHRSYKPEVLNMAFNLKRIDEKPYEIIEQSKKLREQKTTIQQVKSQEALSLLNPYVELSSREEGARVVYNPNQPIFDRLLEKLRPRPKIKISNNAMNSDAHIFSQPSYKPPELNFHKKLVDRSPSFEELQQKQRLEEQKIAHLKQIQESRSLIQMFQKQKNNEKEHKRVVYNPTEASSAKIFEKLQTAAATISPTIRSHEQKWIPTYYPTKFTFERRPLYERLVQNRMLKYNPQKSRSEIILPLLESARVPASVLTTKKPHQNKKVKLNSVTETRYDQLLELPVTKDLSTPNQTNNKVNDYTIIPRRSYKLFEKRPTLKEHVANLISDRFQGRKIYMPEPFSCVAKAIKEFRLPDREKIQTADINLQSQRDENVGKPKESKPDEDLGTSKPPKSSNFNPEPVSVQVKKESLPVQSSFSEIILKKDGRLDKGKDFPVNPYYSRFDLLEPQFEYVLEPTTTSLPPINKKETTAIKEFSPSDKPNKSASKSKEKIPEHKKGENKVITTRYYASGSVSDNNKKIKTENVLDYFNDIRKRVLYQQPEDTSKHKLQSATNYYGIAPRSQYGLQEERNLKSTVVTSVKRKSPGENQPELSTRVLSKVKDAEKETDNKHDPKDLKEARRMSKTVVILPRKPRWNIPSPEIFHSNIRNMPLPERLRMISKEMPYKLRHQQFKSSHIPNQPKLLPTLLRTRKVDYTKSRSLKPDKRSGEPIFTTIEVNNDSDEPTFKLPASPVENTSSHSITARGSGSVESIKIENSNLVKDKLSLPSKVSSYQKEFAEKQSEKNREILTVPPVRFQRKIDSLSSWETDVSKDVQMLRKHIKECMQQNQRQKPTE